MKRGPALVSLSRDHHRALSVAQQLRRATLETAADARAAFLTYWDEHGRAHFRAEEEVLLPAYAGHADAHHPLVARALCDHVAIRHRAGVLAGDPAPTLAALHELGSTSVFTFASRNASCFRSSSAPSRPRNSRH